MTNNSDSYVVECVDNGICNPNLTCQCLVQIRFNCEMPVDRNLYFNIAIITRDGQSGQPVRFASCKICCNRLQYYTLFMNILNNSY